MNPLSAILVAAAALAGMTACSSDSKTAPAKTVTSDTAADTTEATADTTAKTAAPTTVAATAPTTPATVASTTQATTASSGPSPAELKAQLEPLLLTPAEIGPTFVKDTYSDPAGGTPCGVEVDSKYPPYTIAGTQIVQPEPVRAMIEEIRVYSSRDDAKAAYELAVSGFSCGTAEGLTLGTPTDVSKDLGVTGVGISLSTTDYDGAIVLALDRDAIVVFQFQAAKGLDTSAVPDPLTVSTAGVSKIEASLNG